MLTGGAAATGAMLTGGAAAAGATLAAGATGGGVMLMTGGGKAKDPGGGCEPDPCTSLLRRGKSIAGSPLQSFHVRVTTGSTVGRAGKDTSKTAKFTSLPGRAG